MHGASGMHTEAFSIRWQQQQQHNHNHNPNCDGSTIRGSTGIAPTRPLLQHLLAIGARPTAQPKRQQHQPFHHQNHQNHQNHKQQARASLPPQPPLPSALPPAPAAEAAEAAASAAAAASSYFPPKEAPAGALGSQLLLPRILGCSIGRGHALHLCVCVAAFALLEGAAILHTPAPGAAAKGAGVHYRVNDCPHASRTRAAPLDGLVHAALPLLGMYIGYHATLPANPGLRAAVSFCGAIAVCTSALCILSESCVLAREAHAMYVARRGLQACTVLSVSLYFTLHRAAVVATRRTLMEGACTMLVAILLSCLVAVIQEASTVMMLWGVMALCMGVLAPPSSPSSSHPAGAQGT